MLSPFVCGSFHEEDELLSSPSSIPKKSRKGSKDKNNPFSTRGLDKFNTLLAKLEKKKQKIYSQMGSDDQVKPMVRFVYKSSSNDVVPIVIRLKDRKQVKSKSGELVREKIKDQPIEAGRVPEEKEVNLTRVESHKEKTEQKKFNYPWDFKMKKWRRPSFYVPVALVLILIFLVFFGRSVAILCTSIGWYSVPTLSSTSKKPKKKENVRGHGEIKMVNKRLSPPRSSNNHNKFVATGKKNWHRQSGHRKSF